MVFVSLKLLNEDDLYECLEVVYYYDGHVYKNNNRFELEDLSG